MPDGVNLASVHYPDVFAQRIARLQRIRSGELNLTMLKAHYRLHPGDFINDWGVTYDPRNVGSNSTPAYLPFLLFPRQRQVVDYVVTCWQTKEYGLIEKSRDMGISWLVVGIGVTLCLFYEDMAIGFGSRKEVYVDNAGDPKSLFWKARMFIENLPPEFRGDWDRKRDTQKMRIVFPGTRSVMTGEAGDNIGRGDRTGIHFVDEAAYLERPLTIDAALSQTTNCRIDVSSANGMNNPFAQRRHSGKFKIFTYHWRDDPRKDDAWYAKQVHDLDPVVVAQEIDINYLASVEGVLIPSEWIQSAIDAHIKLGLEVRGAAYAALDVADLGKDKNAICGATGFVAQHMSEWRGATTGDIYATTQKAFKFCDDHGYRDLIYDADGMGAGIRGDARVINEGRAAENLPTIRAEGFWASGAVLFPEREDIPGRQNKDYFKNLKVQKWWTIKERFRKTHRAVTTGEAIADDDLIAIASTIEGRDELVKELAQIQWGIGTDGRVVIIKAPEGMPSPNRADAFMMRMGTTLEPAEKFFTSSDMMLKHEPVDVTQRPDLVFATIMGFTSEGRDQDAIGIVYFAHWLRKGYPLMVLDWDITEVKGDTMERWLPVKLNAVAGWLKRLQARMPSPGAYTVDKDLGSVIIQQAAKQRLVVRPIEVKIEDEERALNVSTYLRSGSVRISSEAYNRKSLHKGSEANHLLQQLGAYHAGMKGIKASVLLNCFTHGVTLSQGNADGF